LYLIVAQVLESCVEMINTQERVQRLLAAVDQMIQPAVLQALCQVCHNLLILRKLNNHKHRCTNIHDTIVLG
jgi:ubiquitin-protein ligase E3 C